MRVGREAAHVRADLGEQHLGGAPVDAGDRVQQLELTGERAGQLLDPLRQGRDRLVEEVDLGEHLPDQQRVVAGEAALERFAQRGDLLAQRALGQLGEHLGVVGAGDQRVEHPPGGHAEHLGGDRGELDPGVLQGLLDPLHLAGALLDLGLAVADQVAQLAQRPGRHEARPDQAVLDQLAAPLGVLHIALATGDVTKMASVVEPALELVLEQVEHRPPVDAGGLHPDHRHRVAAQPVRQREQPRGGGRRTRGSPGGGRRHRRGRARTR